MDFYPSLIVWPEMLMRDRRVTWALSGQSASGGRTLSGVVPRMRLDGGGIWMATLSDLQVSTPDQVRVYRALEALLDGGARPVVLTRRDTLFYPAPVDAFGARVTGFADVSCDDGAYLDDGSGFYTSTVDATADAAALRATTLTVTITVGSALKGGEVFSIEHATYSHRMYTVAKVDGSQITIRPPLREAITGSTRLEFDYPKCVMQLSSTSEMDLPMELRTYGQTTVKFLESFPPWA